MKRGQIERLANQILAAAARGDLQEFGVGYDPQQEAITYTELVTEYDDPVTMGTIGSSGRDTYAVVPAHRAETAKRLCAMIYADGAEMFIVVGSTPVFLVKLLRGIASNKHN